MGVQTFYMISLWINKENPSQMISIIALIRVKGSAPLEELNSLFRRLIDETRKESGCQRYELQEVTDQAGLFMMMEEWKSEVALELHNNSKHFNDFVSSASPYFAAPIEEFPFKRLI